MSVGPTVAVLYPGDLGAALARLLVDSGTRVVTTLDGRSERTAGRARDAGIEILPSLDQVARCADVTVSLVLPAAAISTASAFRRAAEGIGRGGVYIDANSVAPETVRRIAEGFSGSVVRFVDGAIRGASARLATHGTLYLAGEAAQDIASVFEGLLPVRVLGDQPGRASELRMLMTGLAKGLVGLVGELGVAASRADLLEEALAGYREHYPGVMEVVDRMLPTYEDHAGRRADEMAELEDTLRGLGSPSAMVAGARALHQRLSEIDPPDLNEWTPEAAFTSIAGMVASDEADRDDDNAGTRDSASAEPRRALSSAPPTKGQ